VADDQDPHSQQIIETHSQTFFIALTVSFAFRVRTSVNKAKYQTISFLLSYISKSVLLGLEVFTAGFIVLLLVCPPFFFVLDSNTVLGHELMIRPQFPLGLISEEILSNSYPLGN
jgi:hypothetical protein